MRKIVKIYLHLSEGTAKILSVAFFPDTVYIIVNYNVLHTYMWCLSILA